jgi:O-antigen/teichoic acid export membrane protein
MNSAWNLLTGTATKYVLLAVNIVLGIFLMPYTVRHLGMTEYGLWMLAASMTSYFQLLDLGYGNGLVRHIADADARGNTTLVNQILSTFVIVYAGLGLIAGIAVAAMVVWVVPNFPRLQPEQISLARFVVAMIGVRIAVGFPMTVFGATTTARQRFALNNMVAAGIALAGGGATFVLLALGYRVRAVVTASTVISLLGYIAYAWTAKIAFPKLRLRASAFNRGLVRDVTAFSFYVFVIDIAIQIGFNLDNVIVGAALGTSAVAVYAVTLRLADAQRQLSCQFNTVLFPVVVRYGAANDPSALRRMLFEGTRLSLTLVCGVTVCLMGFAAPLITRWMGPGFEASAPPLQVLALAGVVLIGQGPLGNILMGTGRHKLVAYVTLGEAVSNLALSVVLIRHFGLLGVAIGTAVPMFVANVFILAPAACRQLGVGVVSFAREVSTAPIVGAAVAAAAGFGLRSALPPQSIAAIIGEGAMVGLVYVAAVWTLGFSDEVRERYSAFGRQLYGMVLHGPAPLPSVTQAGAPLP